MRAMLISIASLICAPFAAAAVVVIANGTGAPVECKVALGAAEPQAITLAVAESKAIVCGRTIEVTYTAADGVKRLKLEPYNVYIFTEKKSPTKTTVIELLGIELVGQALDPKDVPEAIPDWKTVKVKVKLLVDDEERRTAAVWKPALAKRLARASEIMLRDAGFTFEIEDNDEWTVDPNGADLRTVLTDFEKKVPPAPAALAIGFVSRNFAPPMGKDAAQPIPFAASRGLFAPNIIIRETEPRTEPERMEVLVQQLGRWLGALPSRDALSVMRPKLGDGKAVHVRFRVGFDPLNELAINIIGEEYRKGSPRKIADWPAVSQLRLARVYATLNLSMPEEPLSDEVAALLDRAGVKVAAALEVKPMKEPNAVDAPKPKGERILTAEQEATRKVLKAIVVKAEENARKPAAGRVKGDELTELYIRSAADVAYTLEEKLRKKAFLIALGIGLDDSDLARNAPVFGELCKSMESDDERKARIAVLGNPSIRFRRDLCQHFAISAALTAYVGATIAEGAGLAKEAKDMEDMKTKNGSGFDFSDLVGDFSGVEFGKYVIANGERLKLIREKFAITDFVPKVEDLADGLSEARFKERYGSFEDKRFSDAVEAIRTRVKEMPAYRVKKDN